jgi:hypothetical protein
MNNDGLRRVLTRDIKETFWSKLLRIISLGLISSAIFKTKDGEKLLLNMGLSWSMKTKERIYLVFPDEEQNELNMEDGQ